MPKKKPEQVKLGTLPKALFVCAGLVQGNTPKEPFTLLYRFVDGAPDLSKELLFDVKQLKLGSVYEFESETKPEGGTTVLFPKKAWAVDWYRGDLRTAWEIRSSAVSALATKYRDAALMDRVGMRKALEPLRSEYLELRTSEQRIAFTLAIIAYLEK